MLSQEDSFQKFSSSSQDALAWAFTRARHSTSCKENPPCLVSATDLLVGVFLAHRNDSEPLQLFRHFQVPLESFYKMLRDEGSFMPDNAPTSPERLDKMPPLDKEAEYIVNESIMLSNKLNPEKDKVVRLRDLFGGILTTSNKANHLLKKALSVAGVPFKELEAKYPEFLQYSSQEMCFDKFLADRFSSLQSQQRGQAQVLQSIRFAVSGFNADTRTDRDLIGIGAEVDAFAYLIAAKSLQPPMAIGLFGDWGSGKSFFMEALRRRIHKITEDAQQSGKPQREISIYKYIAQIEFNAWHYVEGELWASLVEHIFRNLKTRSEDEPTLLQQRQQKVIEKLKNKRRALQATQSRKDKLKNQLTRARGHVTQLEKERGYALEKLNELKARDILKAVELTKEEKEDINQRLKELGVTKTYTNAAEMMHCVDELRDVLMHGNALITPLRKRGWKWVTALIFVILIGPAISFALKHVSEVTPVTTSLASVSAFLSGLTIMIKRGTTWLSGALNRVEGARLKLDEGRRKTEVEFANKIAEAEREYNEKVVEYEQAKNEEKRKEQEIASLGQELQRITPGRVLLDFISERVGSQDYRKHLGIAALIRSDFEQLSQLIESSNRKFGEDDNGTVGKKEDKHLINRIVLYIDDLDRCPPDRVVQVLQAVHLLLAFPLFVVVVAVDARWLSQSLQTHYQNLLATNISREGLELSEGFGRQASPQDYLEKIFQVPFWVRPLPEKARIRIVQGLVAESLVQSPAARTDDGEMWQVARQQDEKEHTAANIKAEGKTMHGEVSERRRPLNLDAETELKPESLDIVAIEHQFMNELGSLLGQTPRSVKRFVNVYRLIKAVSLDQEPKFVQNKSHADCKLVLFLLAVLTGLPAISREFFRQLRGERSEVEQSQSPSPQVPPPTGRTMAQVLDELHKIVLHTPKMSPDRPVQSGQNVATPLGLAEDNHKNGHGQKYESWYAFREFERLNTWLKRYDSGSWLKSDATALADWTPRVARYSYRIEEL